ncbi:hypothetical protein HYU90_01705, partial [Candidatus Collierbacteria bacterium]|nr:hypothetical protein [Candidatus Collierbacteria bacterium]
ITATSGLTANGTLDANAVVTLGDNGDNVTIDSNVWDVTAAGAASGLTGISSSGNIDLSALSAGGIVKAAVTTGRLAIATAGTDYENPLTFSNGLVRSVNAVKLGGTLTAATDIPLGGFNLTFSGTGNVGIGTTAPTAPLTVVGDVVADRFVDKANASSTYYIDPANITTSMIVAGNVSIGMTTAVSTLNLDKTTENAIAFYDGGTARAMMGVSSGTGQITAGSADNDFVIRGQQDVLFTSNGGANTFMTLKAAGNLGIGTTAPGSRLDVLGTLRLSGATSGYVGLAPAADAGSTTYTLPSADGTNGYQLTTNGTGTLSWTAAGGGSSQWTTTGSDIYYNTGKVGIGITVPTSMLHVASSGAKTTADVAAYINNTSTSSTSSINKYGLQIASTGTWDGGGGVLNYGLYVSSVTGGANNVDAVFAGGNGVTVGSPPAYPIPAALTINKTGSFGFKLLNLHFDTGYSDSRAYTFNSFTDTVTAQNPLIISAVSNAGAVTRNIITYQFGGNVGIGTTRPTALLHLGIGSTAVIGQKITLASGATANAFEVNTSAGVGGDKFVILAGGNVGIGTTAPADKLNIAGGGLKFDTTASAMDLASGTTNQTFIFKISKNNAGNACGTGDAEGLIFQNTSGTQVGHACIGSADALKFYGDSFNATSTDLAENYSDATDSLQPGDIVVVDENTHKGVKKSSGSNANKLIGIVSTDPGLVLSDISEDGGKTTLVHPKPIALKGRVPTKVSTENGPISVGDFLTSSSLPGVAMKANKAGETLGKALENYNNSDPQQVGTILTYVNVSWYDPDVYFTATGDLHINQNAQGDYAVQNTSGQTITNRLSVFASSFIANLTAGMINTQKLFTNELVSPIAEIDTLRVNTLNVADGLLSPLANIDEIVATNATISGLTRLNEVTAVTLYAANIVSPEISDLKSQISNISSDYATASAILASIKAKYADYASLNNPNAVSDPLSTTNLSSQNATISGEMTLYNQPVIITDALMVNTSLISNSINSNDTALYIQPTANQPINLLAGLMILTLDGKVAINGDLSVTGNIAADTLSVAEGQITNLESQTATISGSLTATNATVSGSLAANQAIISDLVIASSSPCSVIPSILEGSSSAGMTNCDATASGTLASNATIGTATIASGSAEVKIENSKIVDSTYIYLTPISDTANQVLYIKNKTTCSVIPGTDPGSIQIDSGSGAGMTNCIPSFTVSITDPVAKDIKFNYWLIQTHP